MPQSRYVSFKEGSGKEHILAKKLRVNRVQMDVLVGGLAGVLFSEQPVELETFEAGLAVQNKLDRTGGRIFD